MISAEQNEQGTDSGRHEEQSCISKDVFPQPACTVLPAQRIDLFIRTSIKWAEIKITARFVHCRVGIVGIEYAMNNKVCECKEQTREPAWLARSP